mgnify:CR=1 FL=1
MAHSLGDEDRRRWHAFLRERSAHSTSPTAGVLFNRANPLNEDGDFVHPYDRKRDLAIDEEKRLRAVDNAYNVLEDSDKLRIQLENWRSNRKLVPVFGYDITSVNPSSWRKYRIPNTSVVNKKGDLKWFFGLCGSKLTAAQWLWWLNLLALLAHTAMCFVTLFFAYWRWGRSIYDTRHMIVRIYRVTPIPTQEMIDNNLTNWVAGRWNLTSGDGTSGNGMPLYLRDNDLPVNFATLTISFFACSAIAHLWAVVCGAFERFWFIYWRQLDDAFAYWRWAEYSVSSGLMAMALSISIGIREQSILALLFMCHWCTCAFGFLTEYISTPKVQVDTNDYKYPIGPDQFRRFFSGEDDFAKIDADDYIDNPRALKIIDQAHWSKDRPAYFDNEWALAKNLRLHPRAYVSGQRTRNYVRRMVPHILGWFPCTAAWVVIVTHYVWISSDLREVTTARIPSGIEGALVGTVVLFWSFTAVRMPPHRALTLYP